MVSQVQNHLSVADPTMSWREFCALPSVNAPKRAGLSPAELVAAMQLVQGSSNKEIAQALGKSACTVKNQVSAILRKCGCPSRARLMVLLRPAGEVTQGTAHRR